jgi:hypothetical protein
MSADEPYKVPDGCSVDIELDTTGGVQNTVIRIRRADGSVETTFKHIVPQPTWWDD